MRIVKQKNSACMPTAIYMLNENKDFRKIKAVCKKRFGHSVSKRIGCEISDYNHVVDALHDLGFKDAYLEPPGQFRFLNSRILYRKALVFIIDRFGIGHAVAWDGHKFYDPSVGVMTEKNLFSVYSNYDHVMIISVKTPFIKRVVNAFIKPFYEIFSIPNFIHGIAE